MQRFSHKQCIVAKLKVIQLAYFAYYDRWFEWYDWTFSKSSLTTLSGYVTNKIASYPCMSTTSTCYYRSLKFEVWQKFALLYCCSIIWSERQMLKMKMTASSVWRWVVEGGWCEINRVELSAFDSLYNWPYHLHLTSDSLGVKILLTVESNGFYDQSVQNSLIMACNIHIFSDCSEGLCFHKHLRRYQI